MASGLPVISTVNGGQGEFLLDGVNCLSFPPSDASHLARQIQTLAEDSDLYKSLVEAGRETVEKGFTFSRYVADLQRLLEKAISQTR
jgi:glycosyltransferase involved in cell wall biosynthesis